MVEFSLSPPAPPPVEYCLLWADRWFPDPWWLCMQKSEWSGWAQALGAIVALAIAVWLPARAKRQARADAKATAVAFVAGAIFAAQCMLDACERQHWADFQTQRHLLEDAAANWALLHTTPLRSPILAKAMGVRVNAVALFHNSGTHSASGNWEHWRAQFEENVAHTTATLAEIKKLKA